jgi:DNA invertase Pin-like site-specific DNA recombinase
MNKPAAIYARVSSDRQKENHTIASQTAALIEYAQKNGYSVPPEWVFQDEGYSGAILVRPGLEALRDLAAEGQIAAALIYSPDRLSRKYAYQVLLSEELSRCGVELIFLKAPAGAHPGGSTAGAISRHDCRIRTRPNRRAMPSRQEAHGATGRRECAFRRTLWLSVCEEERLLGGLL